MGHTDFSLSKHWAYPHSRIFRIRYDEFQISFHSVTLLNWSKPKGIALHCCSKDLVSFPVQVSLLPPAQQNSTVTPSSWLGSGVHGLWMSSTQFSQSKRKVAASNEIGKGKDEGGGNGRDSQGPTSLWRNPDFFNKEILQALSPTSVLSLWSDRMKQSHDDWW